MRPIHPLPPHLTDRPFTTAQAHEAGLPAARLARSDLCSPFRGVHMDRALAGSFAARCQAALLVSGPGALICELSALRLLGVDLPGGLDREEQIHVQVPAASSSPRRAGLVRHRSVHPPPDASVLSVERPPGDPLVVVAPAHAWVQAAGRLGVKDLVVIGDGTMRRGEAWCRPEDLAEAAESARRRRGSARAREALRWVRPGTDSIPETLTRLMILALGFPPPQVNRPIRDADGRVVAIPDLSYPEARVAVEYDGDHHRTDRTTWQRDVRRRRQLEAMGWRVVSVTADDLRDPAPVRAALEAALRSAAA